MTNQEAIKTLNEADTCFCKHGAFKDCHSRCKYKDALDMAINALKAIEDIKAEIISYRDNPANDFDFEIGAINDIIAIIDKHIGKDNE